jgi:hypothetical protein
LFSVMPRESGASSIPWLQWSIATFRITGSPAFAGDDVREMSGARRQ